MSVLNVMNPATIVGRPTPIHDAESPSLPIYERSDLDSFDHHLVAGHANDAYRRAAIEKIAAGKHVDRPLAETAFAAGPQRRVGNAQLADHRSRIAVARPEASPAPIPRRAEPASTGSTAAANPSAA